MKKILTVFGTRPEAIKMAPVVKCLQSRSDFISEICLTAQHRQMLDQVLDLFDISADYDLAVMEKNQNLFTITTKVLNGLKNVIEKSKPDIILVQGDTTTTFATSLAAFYLKVPIGHIEAGLRTYDKYSPFPEEVNRRVVTTIADLNFSPTKWAEENLLSEGVPKEKIFVTGNTIVDALYETLKIIGSDHTKHAIEEKFAFLGNQKKTILITGHRRESFGKGFENICNAIKRLAGRFTECNFVYPVHLNPNVQKPVQEILNSDNLHNIHLIEPLEYSPFVYLMKKADLILTDSGGVQEEAISFGTPVLVMRDVTERPEGLQIGAVKLVGTKEENIFKECKQLLTSKTKYDKMANKQNPYGDGKAAEKIVDILAKKLT